MPRSRAGASLNACVFHATFCATRQSSETVGYCLRVAARNTQHVVCADTPTGAARRARALSSALLLCAACGGGVDVDEAETEAERGELSPGPVVEFDPGARVIPFPNNLLLNPETGRLAIPPGCGETEGSSAEALRATLNQLDGFGTSRLVIRTSVSEPVAPSSLLGNVFLMRIAERGAPLAQPEPVDATVLAVDVTRIASDCATPVAGNDIVIVPSAPLPEASTYAVFVLRGIETEDGLPLQPSTTWALVRQPEPPVEIEASDTPAPESVVYNATPFDPRDPDDLASLVGLDLLWRVHAPLLGAFDAVSPALPTSGGRDDVLLAWSFNTQTLSDPLDAAVEDSPAAQVAAASALTLPPALAGEGAPVSVEAFFAGALPGASCAALGCAAIGSIYTAAPGAPVPTLSSINFQSGEDCDPETAVPAGPWADPLSPEPVCDQTLPVLAVVPSTPAPAEGYPTVIFAHGLGRSKEDLLALAGTLASAGFASVAIDAVAHGARAVQVSTDEASGCGGPAPGTACETALAPTCAPQCYAPILSANLGATRDNLRQTVLDQIALARALEGCAEEGACGTLRVDPARIGYVGQSLGALIGGVSVAVSGVPAGVLNVGGADWLQVLTDTSTLPIRCPLVDALIRSGVIAGTLWNSGAEPNATCVGERWKEEPGFVQFAAAARWLLDSVDGVNFARTLAAEGGPSVLVAEVEGDSVVPNSATETFVGLLGLEGAPAAIAAAVPPTATPEASRPGSRWIVYSSLGGDAATSFPGNAYGHGSLLAPVAPSGSQGTGSGELGTALMRTDTVTYLLTHL